MSEIIRDDDNGEGSGYIKGYESDLPLHVGLDVMSLPWDRIKEIARERFDIPEGAEISAIDLDVVYVAWHAPDSEQEG